MQKKILASADSRYELRIERVAKSWEVGRVTIVIPDIWLSSPGPKLAKERCHKILNGVGTFLEKPNSFLSRTLEKLLGGRPKEPTKITVTIFQNGDFQSVLHVRTFVGEMSQAAFVLIVSNDPIINKVTSSEYALINSFFKQDSRFIVEPLAFQETDSPFGALAAYSTKYYHNFYELGYTVDGIHGRAGIYLHSLNIKRPYRLITFPPEVQSKILEEMVAALATYYHVESGDIPMGVAVSRGDFMVDPSGNTGPEVKLVTIRSVLRGDPRTPELNIAVFIHILKNFFVMRGHLAILLFDEGCIRNGLTKIFMRNGLSNSEAIQKAGRWFEIYSQAEGSSALRNVEFRQLVEPLAYTDHTTIMNILGIIQQGNREDIIEALAPFVRMR